MRILRSLCSHDFKLQPFPDERLDSNPVCSTGVHSHPSASNIQRMAPVFWRDDCFTSFFLFIYIYIYIYIFKNSSCASSSVPSLASLLAMRNENECFKKKKKISWQIARASRPRHDSAPSRSAVALRLFSAVDSRRFSV